MRPVWVTADDYALAPALSAAIRELVGDGRLSGTSAMTTFAEWPDEAVHLRPLLDDGVVGVHLTLTDHAPLGPCPRLAPDGSFPSFPTLARDAWLGRLSLAEIEAELTRQVERLRDVLGRPPDFLDGHHHVHQLPGVRDVVVALARTHLGPAGWVRTCADSTTSVLARGGDVGRGLLFATAGAGLARRLTRAGVPTNPTFAGVYGFTDAPPFPDRMATFLQRHRAGGAVMVHPGRVDDTLRERDSLTTPREVEADHLASAAFVAQLQAANVRVARRADLPRR